MHLIIIKQAYVFINFAVIPIILNTIIGESNIDFLIKGRSS